MSGLASQSSIRTLQGKVIQYDSVLGLLVCNSKSCAGIEVRGRSLCITTLEPDQLKWYFDGRKLTVHLPYLQCVAMRRDLAKKGSSHWISSLTLINLNWLLVFVVQLWHSGTKELQKFHTNRHKTFTTSCLAKQSQEPKHH